MKYGHTAALPGLASICLFAFTAAAAPIARRARFCRVFRRGNDVMTEGACPGPRPTSSISISRRPGARSPREALVADERERAFWDDVCHDLRTPLSIILGYSEMVRILSAAGAR